VRHAIAVGLVTVMAALSAAGIAMHNAAYIAGRRHATASSCRVGPDNLTIRLTARQQTIAACRVFPVDQAAPARISAATEQNGVSMLAATPGEGSVAFSPDGTLLASAYSNGTVWLWNPATGRGMAATTPSAASVDSVAFSPDGKLLAGAYSDGTIRLWDPATGHGTVLLASSPASADSVAFSPDGKLLAGAYSDGTIRLWKPVTGQPGALAGGGWLVTAAAVIAIAVSVLAAAITTREIYLSSRRIPSPGSQLWKYCC